MSLLRRQLQSGRRRNPPYTTVVRDVGEAVRTHRSGGQSEYEPIRATCNRLAQISTCTYLLQRRCESDARPSLTVCAAPRHSLCEELYYVCVIHGFCLGVVAQCVGPRNSSHYAYIKLLMVAFCSLSPSQPAYIYPLHVID